MARRIIVLLMFAGCGAATVLLAAWHVPVVPAYPVDPALLTSSTDAAGLIRITCAGCHASGRTKVDLDGWLDLKVVAREPASWRRVARQVRSGQMPPPNSFRLQPEERVRVLAWIDEGLALAAANEHGRVMARRLRQAEYKHAVQDLMGVAVPANVVLPDDEDIGWDRCLDLPSLTDEAAALYQEAAQRILAEAPLAQLPEMATGAATPSEIEAALARLTCRAFRRPARAAEIANLVTAFDQATAQGAGLEAGYKTVLYEILTSPRFLQHIEIVTEPSAARGAPDEGQFELASRLALLLWNSIPDDELMEESRRGSLQANVEAQTRRMLQDARARRLAEDFAVQWLGLKNKGPWPTVDAALEADMRKETEFFVAAIVAEDRSALEFLDGDTTFVNERLARHYGLHGVYGDEMRRVSLAGTQRAGLFTQASILTATSLGARQSPVHRGKWIMDNLLGTPPPSPPFGLLEAFAQTPREFSAGTARHILEQHRQHESCAYCHAQMDALGMALESFGPAGAWRTHDNGKPIDASVTLPTGERLNGPVSVREYLLERKDMFIRCLGEKLLSFALDRKLLESERRSLDAMPARVAEDGYRFSRVVLEVVASDAFRRGWNRHID